MKIQKYSLVMSKVPSTKHIAMLGMFDVSRVSSAMSVRITNLYHALDALAPTMLLSGNRSSRRRVILQYVLTGGLRQARAVYVEASTSTAAETDLAFLYLAHAMRIPIIIFIPDGYQFFPDIFPRAGLKVKLLDYGWRRSIIVYLHVANTLLYPSYELSQYFNNHQTPVNVLPPAGLAGRPFIPLPWAPPTITYLGAATFRYGSDLLLDAMTQVVSKYPDARCRFVTPEASFIADHPARYAPWLSVETCTFDELPKLMAQSTLAVSPLRINAYNNLAMPVKLFDYMSFGKPIVATACSETAQFLQQQQCGLIVQDTPESLAEGILHLLRNPELAGQLGRNGYAAVQTHHSWQHRAEQLLAIMDEIENHAHPSRQ